MYLISAYFDESGNREIRRLSGLIAKETGNRFLLDHQVPPHLTLSAFEAREPAGFEEYAKEFAPGRIMVVSPGALLPYVMYLTPVLNEYLFRLQKGADDFVSGLPDVRINRYYHPYGWLPHITVGKTLGEEQMRGAFAVLQKHFSPFETEICEIGLARTNPHEDIIRVKL